MDVDCLKSLVNHGVDNHMLGEIAKHMDAETLGSCVRAALAETGETGKTGKTGETGETQEEVIDKMAQACIDRGFSRCSVESLSHITGVTVEQIIQLANEIDAFELYIAPTGQVYVSV